MPAAICSHHGSTAEGVFTVLLVDTQYEERGCPERIEERLEGFPLATIEISTAISWM